MQHVLDYGKAPLALTDENGNFVELYNKVKDSKLDFRSHLKLVSFQENVVIENFGEFSDDFLTTQLLNDPVENKSPNQVGMTNSLQVGEVFQVKDEDMTVDQEFGDVLWHNIPVSEGVQEGNADSSRAGMVVKVKDLMDLKHEFTYNIPSSADLVQDEVSDSDPLKMIVDLQLKDLTTHRGKIQSGRKKNGAIISKEDYLGKILVYKGKPVSFSDFLVIQSALLGPKMGDVEKYNQTDRKYIVDQIVRAIASINNDENVVHAKTTLRARTKPFIFAEAGRCLLNLPALQKIDFNDENKVDKAFNYLAKMRYQVMEELTSVEAIKFTTTITEKENLDI